MSGLERRPTRLPSHRLARRALGAAVTIGTGTLIVTLAIDQPISIDISGKVEGRAQVIIGTPQAVDQAIRELPPVQLARKAAFPGAEGHGAQATWGLRWGAARVHQASFLPFIATVAVPNDSVCVRSSANIHLVTNTNNSGSGSLRDILENQIVDDTLDFVIFRTGGTITLTGTEINVTNNCLHIAGQTAPGDGILIRAPDLQDNLILISNDTSVHDLVIRYLRGRHGRDSATVGGSGSCGGCGVFRVSGNGGASNIIFDRNSVSWALDGTFGLGRHDSLAANTTNITWQWNIIAEPWKQHPAAHLIAGRSSQDAGRGILDISVHHNLYANASQRNPEMEAGDATVDTMRGGEIINNVRYNWSGRPISGRKESVLDIINGYNKPGPKSTVLVHRHWYHDDGWVNDTLRTPSIYISGDTIEGESFPDQWNHIRDWKNLSNELPAAYQRFTRLTPPKIPVTEYTAAQTYDSVLAYAGAYQRLDCDGSWLSARDPVDTRIVAQVQNDSGPNPQYQNVTEAGGWPSMSAGVACTDSDSDGMPDTWEDANGLDKNSAADATLDKDGDGYINLEEYLNGTSP